MESMVIDHDLIKTYGPNLAVYITCLIDNMNKNNITSGEPFIVKQSDLSNQTGLSLFLVRRFKNKLKELGILTTEFKGVPPKEHYTLYLDKLYNE